MNSYIENALLGNALLKGSIVLLVAPLAVLLMRKTSASNRFLACFLILNMSTMITLASVIVSIFNAEISLLPSQSSPTSNESTTDSHATASRSNWNQTRIFETDPITGSLKHGMDLSSKPWLSAEYNSKKVSSSNDIASSNEQPNYFPEQTSAPAILSLEPVAERALVPVTYPYWTQRLFSYWPYLWGIGAFAGLLRLLLPFWWSSKRSSQLKVFDDLSVNHLNNHLARQVRIAIPDLYLCPNSNVPYVIGLRHPRIVLPLEVTTWSTQKLTFVLMHEMAHIKRRDLQSQFLTSVSVAANWFNPAAWWLFAQMMRLRELACDDCVLLQGQPPASYAETLLEVASDYRSLRTTYGIAMAGEANIAGRIHSVLDTTRSRSPFSNRMLRLTVCTAFVLCLFLGTIQLRARSMEPEVQTDSQVINLVAANQETNTQSDKDNTAQRPIDEQARSMLIRVVDEQSNPLEGVDIRISGVDHQRRTNLPRLHFFTDAEGTTPIEYREGELRILVWARLEGFVPQYVEFDEQLLSRSTEYTFYFEKGEKLAGIVVDDTGLPIENASVQVVTEDKVILNEKSQKSSPQARCSGWLASEDFAARTNSKGEWEIQNAPSLARNPKLQFKLLVDHPGFVGDQEWGEYQSRQGITTEQLRNGTARLVMDRGVSIRGSITAPDGSPVTKGIVTWSAYPYFATGVHEVEIQHDGTFKTPFLAPGKYPVTVLAPGFAPQQREVILSHGTPACDFQLNQGNPIRIEIVDSAGKPIPRATISFDRNGWRGTTAIYNDIHSGVLATEIPRHADENGVFTWDWAPPDGVKYVIDKEGYDSKSITLVAKSDPHRVVLTAPLTISGTVIDATTSEPIKEFKAIPVKAFQPDFYSTDFQEGRIATGKEGKYELHINARGELSHRYRVRIEADGYRSALGQLSLAVGEPSLKEDFKLHRAEPLRGIVFSSDGRHVNRFKVAIGTATSCPSFNFEESDDAFGKAFEVIGKNTFEIAASFEPQLLRVFNDDGFVELMIRPEDEEMGEIRLQPYANISGRLLQGEVPIGNEIISFHAVESRKLTEARFQDEFSTRTNPDGSFNFERLPPVLGRVSANLGPSLDSRLTSSQSVPFDLKAGEHKQIVLNGQGAEISGRVVANGRSDDKFSKQWSRNWLVSRNAGASLPPNSEKLSLPSNVARIEEGWLRHSDFDAWLATKENHYVKLREDGFFKIHGVTEGDYDLVIQLYDQPAGCLTQSVGTRVVPITVTPEDVQAGRIDLQTIEVECIEGPNPGSDMRFYQFIDATNQVVSVNDLNGRHVLLHVWASWCAPCLETLPRIQSDIKHLSPTQFTAFGINVDANKQDGQTIAGELKLDWSQNYVGDDSDLARKLAISSVPTYYLIGPDGKLLTHSTEWIDIRNLLHSKLKP